ncbi:MAG: YihY/virulence factor BrkB family protein [Bdellovibrio sp.]
MQEMTVKNLFKHVSWKRIIKHTSDDDVMRMAASLAYYSALSMAPLLILILNFISWINEDYKNELFLQVRNLVGADAGKFVESIARHVEQHAIAKNIASIFGLITLLISASAIFVDLKASLDKIFETETVIPTKQPNQKWYTNAVKFLKERLFNLGIVLGFIFISIISLIVSSLLSFLANGIFSFLGELVNFLISIFIYGMLFSTIYYFLPKKKIKKRIAIISGLLTAVLFSIGKSLIGIYIGHSATASVYGAAGSLIILLVWVFYSAAIFFFSAEIANELSFEAEHG